MYTHMLYINHASLSFWFLAMADFRSVLIHLKHHLVQLKGMAPLTSVIEIMYLLKMKNMYITIA